MLFKNLAAAAGMSLCVGLGAPPAHAGTYIDASSYGAALTNIPAVRARNLVPYGVVYQDDPTSWSGGTHGVLMMTARAGRTSGGLNHAASRGHRSPEDAGMGPVSSETRSVEMLYERVFLARMDDASPDGPHGGARPDEAAGFVPGSAAFMGAMAYYSAGGVVLNVVSGPPVQAVAPVSVPEPASIALFGLGLLGVIAIRRRSVGHVGEEGPSRL